jgi:HlyD family secretion protein
MTARRALGNARWIVGSVGGIILAGFAAWLVLLLTSPSVTVTEAVEGPVVQAFYSTGTVQPEREYPIRANAPGTLQDVKVDKGDKVKVKQIVAVVVDPALKFQVDKADAELKEKLARASPGQSPVLQEFDSKIQAYGEMVDISKREVDRIKGLVEGNAGAQADLDTALDRLKKNWSECESFKSQRAAKLLELQREVDVAKAALATAKSNFDQQSLKSPIDGVILNRPLPLGTRVAVNDDIMRIAQVAPESLVIRAAVDEEDIAKVRLKQTVRLTLYAFPTRSFEGRVTRIYDQADADRRTFEVDVKLAELEPHLQPGMTGELAFVMDSRDRAIVVPSQAVQNGSVYVLEANRLKRRPVQIGLRSVERTEIISGIKPRDRVIISPVANYRDGKRLRPTFIDPLTAAGLNKPPPIQEAFKSFQ